MSLIELNIEIADDEYSLELPKFTKELERFGKEVIRRARISLTKSRKNSTGNLKKSLTKTLKYEDNEVTMTFDAPKAEYWKFVNYGVKGKISQSKAPKSPFKFGSGTGKKGGLSNGIREWIDDKPIKQFRDKKGRFISKDQMGFLITRSVYLYGIKSSEFYSGAFERTFKKYERRLEEAYGEDYGEFFADEFQAEFNIEIQF